MSIGKPLLNHRVALLGSELILLYCELISTYPIVSDCCLCFVCVQFASDQD